MSRVLAERWQWYAASGQLKDMAARTLLLKLHERELIVLPERRRTPVACRSDPGPDLFECVPPAPVVASLSTLRPLQIQVVGPKDADYRRFQSYLRQHHYLGHRGPVGENLAYLIRSRAGVDLACVLFGAVWALQAWTTLQAYQGRTDGMLVAYRPHLQTHIPAPRDDNFPIPREQFSVSVRYDARYRLRRQSQDILCRRS